jgi:predicted NBD/HSP70 family sugar kinase
MEYYAGLDVSVKETSVCIVDKTGKVIRDVKVATKPAAILAVLTEQALEGRLERLVHRILLIPSWEDQSVDPEEKRGPCE